MTDAVDHLDKARELLSGGHLALDVGLLEMAGRNAYLAAFHAASALIVSRTGKLPRTHHGVHTEYAKLTRDDRADLGRFWALLSGSYDLKQTADYFVGPERAAITRDQVTLALAQAAEFTAAIDRAIAPTEKN